MADGNLAVRLLITARDQATRVLRGIGRGFSSLGRGAVRAVTDIRTQITGLIATLGLWKAAQSGIGAASSLEDLELQFEALEGSAERARAKIAEIESAFGLRQAKRALELYSDLAAFGLKPTVDQMRSLIDFNAKLGKGQENLSGIVSQLGQAWGKQKLQYEDILILLERGVPVSELWKSEILP